MIYFFLLKLPKKIVLCDKIKFEKNLITAHSWEDNAFAFYHSLLVITTNFLPKVILGSYYHLPISYR